MVRTHKKAPSDESLPSLFFSQTDEVLLSVIKGHLVLDAIACRILIAKGYGNEIWRWSFPKKYEKLQALNLVDASIASICTEINDIRNDFCHSLGHEVSFDEIWEKSKHWRDLGLEYSDDGMFEDRQYAMECYQPEVIIQETVTNLVIFYLDEVQRSVGLSTTFETE